MMSKKLESILIIGGGTAGWLSAAIIAARHGQDISITLVESPEIKTIGVGEGTWPTMKSTLKEIGVSETDFLRECDASFKQGAKFCGWRNGKPDDFYYHPLMLPREFEEVDSASLWLNYGQADSFSNSMCFQEALCEANIAPKSITMPEYTGAANYAYHLDAGKFSHFLKKHCVTKLNVKHRVGTIKKVSRNTYGDISSLTTEDNNHLSADLYIDCTGFKSLLLGQALNVPFIDKSDILFLDRALTVHAPYDPIDKTSRPPSTLNHPIAPYTISTAQSSGWIWDIGLQSRRGVGHVYSSKHIDDRTAKSELAHYLNRDTDELEVNQIHIPCGHRDTFWKNNCVAIGLSAGFLEPLEASALVLIEMSAQFVRDQLPKHSSVMPIIAKRFNSTFKYRWDRIIDFLKLHYILSERQDSAFWKDHQLAHTIPASLQELLALWKYQSPWRYDFTQKDEIFPAASYQYVLYGMGFKTFTANPASAQLDQQTYKRIADETHFVKQRAMNSLPDTRQLLNQLTRHRMQVI